MQTILLTLAASSAAYLTVKFILRRREKRQFAPGPRPKPFIGNLFDFPGKDNAAETYVQWAQKYKSDILFISALGSHVLVLNKREDVFELLERRSHKYSDRPFLPLLQLMGWDKNISLMPYGNFWRLHKKICQQHFRPEAAPSYNPVQLSRMKVFLRNLLEHPEEFEVHNKLFSTSISLATVYGYDAESAHDPCIEAADEGVFIGTKLIVPGGSFITLFPLLRHVPAWFPGATSQKIAARAKELTLESIRIPMDILKSRMAKGAVPPSIVSTFMERKAMSETSQEEELIIENVAYTVYAAASDTTVSSTGSFFYLIATHPDVQKKAQEEIDRVVGSSHLPTFEDRKRMPYVEAVYREVMRWKPPLPICLPHVLSEDDYYKGYFIPKGTTVLANIWAMTHDNEVYDKPFDFLPERFLDGNGELNDDDRVLAYGFGRRICVGKHVASSTMWLLIASILATFNIEKKRDDDGNEIPINDDYRNNGFLLQKLPFKCSITPRSERVKDLFMD